MNLTKPKRERDAAYLEFIRAQDCLVCGECEGIDAHHVLEIGQGKTGSKASDRRTVPLCREAHQQYHSKGRSQFEMEYSLDLEKEIQRLNALYRPVKAKKERVKSASLKIVGKCEKGHATSVPLVKLTVKGRSAKWWCLGCREYVEVA